MNRLQHDDRFTLKFDYQGDFIPSPVEVTVKDPDLHIKTIAEMIYKVAKHPVKLDGEYLVGSEADLDLHK